ncbi:hypothetical protein BKA56DRAFT_611433 [Ilyonectria sp. MPI-CAGE-AT-0026]|nr:hypothetical protein BKA56DRAFT_611433 [Ilyonectria sp. MPI-CAGE-AT-0026]
MTTLLHRVMGSDIPPRTRRQAPTLERAAMLTTVSHIARDWPVPRRDSAPPHMGGKRGDLRAAWKRDMDMKMDTAIGSLLELGLAEGGLAGILGSLRASNCAMDGRQHRVWTRQEDLGSGGDVYARSPCSRVVELGLQYRRTRYRLVQYICTTPTLISRGIGNTATERSFPIRISPKLPRRL